MSESAAPQPLRGTGVILTVVALAFVVSVIHYIDNYVNYDDYPVPPADSSLPVVTDTLIAAGWFVFTAFGVVAVVSLLRRRVIPTAVGLAFYSVSGLIGIGHYTVPGSTDMPWWRQAHVVADIGLGAALLILAWLVFSWNRPRVGAVEVRG
ncbi:hypothetical protein [Aeromicrobium sp.]|uniref:hypothetical protein n=1 Tax=Aeromicrobium sp. TaxID=1871063 RepID=UPI0039E60AED